MQQQEPICHHTGQLEIFQRRHLLGMAVAWAALACGKVAQARGLGNVIELRGGAEVNGQPIRPDDTLQTGDQLATGPESSLLFVIGPTAFRLRANTRLVVERGRSLNEVSVVRLVAGGVAMVAARAYNLQRQIVMPSLVALSNGGACYAEVYEGSRRSYFCNCCGDVSLGQQGVRLKSHADYHQAFWGESELRDDQWINPAQPMDHSDEEQDYLARQVGQQTAWSRANQLGSRDGSGTLGVAPAGFRHPADRRPQPASDTI
jgi:hypothetical protein